MTEHPEDIDEPPIHDGPPQTAEPSIFSVPETSPPGESEPLPIPESPPAAESSPASEGPIEPSAESTADLSQPAAQQELELVAVAAPEPIAVAWIGGQDTIDRFSSILQPQAIGLIDEMVKLMVVCSQPSDIGNLPCPPVDVLRFSPMRWVGLHPNRLAWIAQSLLDAKIDLLHSLDASAADLTRHLALRTNLNYVVTCRSQGDQRRIGTLDSRLAAVLAASAPIQRELLDHYVSAAGKIHLARPGVYQARHADCFDAIGRSVAILAGASLDNYTDWLAILRSFAELLQQKRDCVFFIIGSGRAERQVRQQARSMGLGHQLTFGGHQPVSRMGDLLQAADLYVSPSPSGAYDVQALLATAAGVPVVAAANAAADFLIDGKTAMTFPAGDSFQLTLRLQSLLDNHAAARAQAESALHYLRENHSPARMVAWLANTYRQAVGNRQ